MLIYSGARRVHGRGPRKCADTHALKVWALSPFAPAAVPSLDHASFLAASLRGHDIQVVARMSSSMYHVFIASEQYEELINSNAFLPPALLPAVDDGPASAKYAGSPPKQSSLVRAARANGIALTPAQRPTQRASAAAETQESRRVSHDAFIAAFDRSRAGAGGAPLGATARKLSAAVTAQGDGWGNVAPTIPTALLQQVRVNRHGSVEINSGAMRTSRLATPVMRKVRGGAAKH